MIAEDIIISLIKDFFIRYGIRYSEHLDCQRWLIHYFNFRLKYIGASKREVKISLELKSKQLDFNTNKAFNSIIFNANHGIDLNSFQSKKSFDSDYDDDLFNDWGIHHLHLNGHKTNPKAFFYDRSNLLLFAKFTETTAYFIDIGQHNEKPLWGKRELISIIQNNWNDELLKDKEVGHTIYPDFNDVDIEILRKKGYLFGINVNGKSYMLLGHGYACSGDNMMATQMTNDTASWVWKNKDLYESDSELFKNEMKRLLYLR